MRNVPFKELKKLHSIY